MASLIHCLYHLNFYLSVVFRSEIHFICCLDVKQPREQAKSSKYTLLGLQMWLTHGNGNRYITDRAEKVGGLWRGILPGRTQSRIE